MSYQTMRYEVADGIGRITLTRPPANALNLEMAEELAAVALEAEEDPEVRCVVLTGDGKVFCAGGDLGFFASHGDRMAALLKEMTGVLHLGISRLARMEAPVIMAINGTAAGAGFSMAAAGDLAIASDQAKFTMAYTNAGLTPDGSSTYYLPRLIGDRRTKELMITNRLLSAQEALDWGIVNQVVPADELEAAVTKLASRIVAGPKGAYGQVKKLLLMSNGAHFEAQMEAEGRAIAEATRTPEGKEGIDAFLNKRKPNFRG